MDKKQLKEWIDLFEASSLSRLSYQQDELKIEFERTITSSFSHQQIDDTKPMVNDTDSKNLILSPIVGTFYRAPAENQAPFVEIGDVIKPGQILCIIEAMKMNNEIASEVSGTIIEFLVNNGEPVEFNQPLMRIKHE